MRRGELSTDMLYWLFYMPLTIAVVFLILYIPNNALGKRVDTANLNAQIWATRVYDAASMRDPLTHRLYPGEAMVGRLSDDQLASAFQTTGSLRRIGVKVTLADRAGAVAYVDKPFYDDASPLAPIRYQEFIEKRPFLVHDKDEVRLSRLEIDQVYGREGGGFS